MAAVRGFTAPFGVVMRRADVDILSLQNGVILDVRLNKRRLLAVKCCCSKIEERLLDPRRKPPSRGRALILPFQ